MPNALARETSPYLLQHAHNPVDWLPWGPEAREKARREDRPILLSIGYSSCHWCHVMERESFEDEETAALMNEAFVNVKVDREERPDVDAVYMRAVQALTGRGGWPLTVFLTPEGEPYYGGTYYPPEPRHGMPSFRQVLRATRDAYRDRREDVARAASEIRELLERSTRGAATDDGGSAEPGPWGPRLRDTVRGLGARFDPAHGGFGQAPKFPQPLVLEFLLAWSEVAREAPEARQAREMALHTLRSMARGGIRDHLGGGFHRYSVDGRWLVPHFEKMLYDNALLARIYGQAWQITGDEAFRTEATDTLDWLLDDMSSPEGAFYAARDADSQAPDGTPREGAYYVWTPEEVEQVLDPDDARLLARVYDVSAAGNFEGASILHRPHDLDAVARSEEMERGELERRLAAARAALEEARSRRPEPFRDTKVLAGWNGLTVRALAEVGGALERDDYVEAAVRAGSFLLEALRTEEGRLLRVWAGGEARISAFLEDQGAVGNAVVSLWEVTLDPRWLPEIRWACQGVLDHFHDPETGLLYDTAHDAESLVVRPRDTMDNATPSGTSLAAELLLRGGRLLGEPEWTAAGRRVLARGASAVDRAPSAFGRLLTVALQEVEPPVEVGLRGTGDGAAFDALHRTVLRAFLRHRTVAGTRGAEALPEEVPLLEGRTPVEGRATAWVCRDMTCRAPVTSARELERELEAPGEVGVSG